jgi:hypothetical protein
VCCLTVGKTHIRSLVVAAFVLSLILAVTVVMAVTVGHQRLGSPWLAEFRLNECAAPCWNGVVLGQTVFADARMLIEETYGDETIYLVEQFNHSAGDFWLQVTNKVTGYQFNILMSNLTPGFLSPRQRVRMVQIVPLVEAGANLQPPLIADLYSILGEVEGIVMGMDTLLFLYEDNQVVVYVDPLPCSTALPGQEVQAIRLYDPAAFGEGIDVSRILQWRGFGRCHDA